MKEVKLPPQDKKLESAVLGAVLTDKDCIVRIIKDFKPEIFYFESNKLVCESILRLYDAARKIDMLTVISDIRSNGKLEFIGGAYYLTELMDGVVSSWHVEDHIQQLRDLYFAREQISLYSEKVGSLYNFKDPNDVYIDVTNKLTALQSGQDSDNEFSMYDLSKDSIRKRESNGLDKLDFIGYSTSIKDLDKVLGGIKAPDFTIIAGRASMGKTAVAVSLARSMAKIDPGAIFTLEMDAKQIYRRILANESGVNSKKIQLNDLTDREKEFLSVADQNLSTESIIINDTASLHIDRFRALVALYISKYSIKWVIIDYLQLMTAKSQGNRALEVSEISRKLKLVAKEFGIPVIALSQLSREVEKRASTGFKPIMSDLRESGSIEQDADNIIMLWRPEYYGIEQQIPVRGYNQTFAPENLLMFIVAKCRDGETKSVPSIIDLTTSRISDHPDTLFKDEQTTMDF